MLASIGIMVPFASVSARETVDVHTPCSGPRYRTHMPKNITLYPLVNIQKAIEPDPFIVDLPIKDGDCP